MMMVDRVTRRRPIDGLPTMLERGWFILEGELCVWTTCAPFIVHYSESTDYSRDHSREINRRKTRASTCHLWVPVHTRIIGLVIGMTLSKAVLTLPKISPSYRVNLQSHIKDCSSRIIRRRRIRCSRLSELFCLDVFGIKRDSLIVLIPPDSLILKTISVS